jgi:hypothetical protein
MMLDDGMVVDDCRCMLQEVRKYQRHKGNLLPPEVRGSWSHKSGLSRASAKVYHRMTVTFLSCAGVWPHGGLDLCPGRSVPFVQSASSAGTPTLRRG